MAHWVASVCSAGSSGHPEVVRTIPEIGAPSSPSPPHLTLQFAHGSPYSLTYPSQE